MSHDHFDIFIWKSSLSRICCIGFHRASLKAPQRQSSPARPVQRLVGRRALAIGYIKEISQPNGILFWRVNREIAVAGVWDYPGLAIFTEIFAHRVDGSGRHILVVGAIYQQDFSRANGA